MGHDALHIMRVHEEMRKAGASNRFMSTSEGRYLERIIHPDEHIGGLIFGISQGSFATLVATDLRIIYLDRKPIFTQFEEITYEVVSGLELNDLMVYVGVCLHTRIKDFIFKWVSKKPALQFVKYIEQKKLEVLQNNIQMMKAA